MANINKVKEELKQSKYNFLKTEEDLGKNIHILKIGGSKLYGTNTETSDTDIRGICSNRIDDMLGLSNRFEQFIHNDTDTVIYTLNKIFSKFNNSNPNTIEIISPEGIIYSDKIGQEIIDNRHLFLSKEAFFSFGGYARGQLDRLINVLEGKTQVKEEQEKLLMRSLETKVSNFNLRYKPKFNAEIFKDNEVYKLNFEGKNLEASEFLNMSQELRDIVLKIKKVGHRNNKKTIEGISKHAMHLIRLYYTGIDILLKEEIIAYREAEHDILCGIRKSDIRDSNGFVRKDILELKDELEIKMKEAYDKSKLPDKPDFEAIQKLLVKLNTMTLKNRGVLGNVY